MKRSNISGPLAGAEWRTHDVIIDGRTLPIRLTPDAGNGVEATADDADLLYYYIPGRPLLDRDSGGLPKLSLTLLLSRQPTAADENVEPLIMGGYLDLTMTLEVPEGTVSQLESVRKADYRPLFAQAATFSLQLMETRSPQTVSAIDPAADVGHSVALDHDAAIDVLQALWGESTSVKARCHLEYRTAATTETVELVSDLSEVIGGCLDGLEAERYIRLIVPEEGGGVRGVGKLVKPAGNLRTIADVSDPHAVFIRVGDRLVAPRAAASPTLDMRSIPISLEDVTSKAGLMGHASHNADMAMSVVQSTSRDTEGGRRAVTTFVSKQYDLTQQIKFTGASANNDGSNADFTEVEGSRSTFNLPSNQPLEAHFECFWQGSTPAIMIIDIRVVLDGAPTIPKRFESDIAKLSVILPPLPAGPHTISVQARGVHVGGPPSIIRIGLGYPITLTVTELGGDVAPGEAETFLSRSFAQPQVISYTSDQGPFVAVTGSPSSFYLPASQHLVARYEFSWWYDDGSSSASGPRGMALDVRFVVDGVETMASRVGRYERGWRTIVVVLPSVTAGQHTISVEVRSVGIANSPVEVHFSCFAPGLGSPAMLAVHALKANYACISWEGLTHPSYRLYQSLSEPATFVLVPVRYCITRFAPDQGERAYRPAAVLYSNVSADTTVDSGAMLLATLCPDIPPWVLTELNQNLRGYVDGRNPTLHLINGIPANIEYGFVVADGVLSLQTHVEKLTDSFQVGLQTTINTAPLLTKMLQLQGVRGMARFKLQGGPTAESELCLDLRSIVGPLPEGPLGTTRNGDQLRVTNNIERAVVITGEKLSSSGSWMADNRRLGPGESYVIDNASLVSFSVPDADPTTLEEVRIYIEDIHVNVKFINLVNFSSHDLRSVLVSAQIQGVPSLQHVSLAENSVGIMDFVLPLTRYLANPILQFQVTRTDTHGNETTTDWHDWALSTKGNVLSLDWEMMQ